MSMLSCWPRGYKNLPAVQETLVQEDSPGEGNGNPLQYSSWRIPWTEEPGGLQSMGSRRVGHWMTEWRACALTLTLTHTPDVQPSPTLWEAFPSSQPAAAFYGRRVHSCGPAHRAFRPWDGGCGSRWPGLPVLFLQVFVAQEVVPASRPLARPADLSQADLGTSLWRMEKSISREWQGILGKVGETPLQVREKLPGRKKWLGIVF